MEWMYKKLWGYFGKWMVEFSARRYYYGDHRYGNRDDEKYALNFWLEIQSRKISQWANKKIKNRRS